MRTLIEIDGSMGEGGGQILRTSLALALVTGEPVRLRGIRAGRRKPGLMRQHLACVRAAAEIGDAELQGDALGSQKLTFRPRKVRPGSYTFAVGSAGSATLVLQTVLPALLRAEEPSYLVLEGGTHNPMAPPFDFLAASFLPLLCRMGPHVEATLRRPGFFPAGGGRFEVRVEPAANRALEPLVLLERGPLASRSARALVSRLPRSIGQRELDRVAVQLGWRDDELAVELTPRPRGPGNALLCTLAFEHVTAVLSGFGERGVPAEKVADDTIARVQRYLATPAPVCRHLADQLLIPLALAGGGAFRTQALSRHTTTNIEVVKRFLDVDIQIQEHEPNDVEVRVTAR
jgi:RNA 3'-terminal phosphate cyclase (ATP)